MDNVNVLEGKRLLILGGSMWKDAIKQYAKKEGIILIATGNDFSAGIFEIADECYRVDSTDIEAMKSFIKEKSIDGVYMGGSEPVISSACQYLNEIKMPCYCTKKQWDWLQDKSKFKNLCIKFDLPVVPKYNIDIRNLEESITNDMFPVITKPTDGCGSNGFSVSHNTTELKVGYEKAQKASPTGSVICEKFVNNNSVVVFYTFSNGKLFFSGLEDKYPIKYNSTGSYVAGMHIFESSKTVQFRNLFDSKIEKMFNSIGIKEGSLWIEVFSDNNEYYFNEVGFRYSGSVSIYPVNYFYKINQVASDIYFALTGKSKIFGHESCLPSNVPHKKYYCIYNVHMHPGKISQINGINELKNNKDIVFIADTKHVNDIVKSTGTVSQVFSFIHFVFNTNEELYQMIDFIFQTLDVRDEQGNSMIDLSINISNYSVC